MGAIIGISGQNEDELGQDITVGEINTTIWGDNNYPNHIAGAASTASSPDVAQGDVVGAQHGDTPLFLLNFTTHNWGSSATRKFNVMTGLRFGGSVGSSSESVYAVAMRATSSATAFTSTNRSDYLFHGHLTASGTPSLGSKTINQTVNLSANTEYYIWAFGVGDDGISSYTNGFINVFGLNN